MQDNKITNIRFFTHCLIKWFSILLYWGLLIFETLLPLISAGAQNISIWFRMIEQYQSQMFTIPCENVNKKRFRKKLWRKNIICRILNIESCTFIHWNGEAGHYINVLNITYEYMGLQLHFYLPRYITIFPYLIGLISVNFVLKLLQNVIFI